MGSIVNLSLACLREPYVLPDLNLSKLGYTRQHVYKLIVELFVVGDKKIRFVVEQPDIVGYIRSTDKRVYNITKGLKIFLQRNNAGILQANDLNVAIWKSGKKNLYFFDASARATDLCQERTGTAVLAKFSKFEALITVLLDKTDLGHSPFTISPLIVKKILGRNEKDEEVGVAERSNYNILNENRAVVQASFDLGNDR